MIARIQALFVLSCLALAAALSLWCADGSGRELLLWLLVPLIAAPQLPILTVEFILLTTVMRSGGDERPPISGLVRAWWGELRASILVFGYRQPFASNRYQNFDAQPAVRTRGVVLVHGFACNRGVWNPWMKELYGVSANFIAVNLEPPLASIDDYSETIEAAVVHLANLTGHTPILVGHSMGGLAIRAWMRRSPSTWAREARIITIGTPHSGTWMGRFSSSTSGRQMRLNSDWIKMLRRDEPMERYRQFTCFYGHCDNVVFPARTATLPGADNRQLAGVAHLAMLNEPSVFAALEKMLGTDDQSDNSI